MTSCFYFRKFSGLCMSICLRKMSKQLLLTTFTCFYFPNFNGLCVSVRLREMSKLLMITTLLLVFIFILSADFLRPSVYMKCPNTPLLVYISAEFVCPSGYVKCPNSYCLPVNYLCDGTRQCPNGDDEVHCCKF